jgi:hypothetical protein
MITSKKQGSVCSEIGGSVCTEMQGSLWSGQVGSLSTEFPPKRGFTYNEPEELLREAQEISVILNTIPRLKKSSNRNIVSMLIEIDKLISAGNKHFYSVTSKDKNDQYVPSFLKIDARLEQIETHRIYASYPKFRSKIEARFKPTFISPITNKETNQIEHVKAEDESKQLISLLLSQPSGTDYEEFVRGEIIHNKPLMILGTIFRLAEEHGSVDFFKLQTELIKRTRALRYVSELTDLVLYFEFHNNVMRTRTPLRKLINLYFKKGTIKEKDKLVSYCKQVHSFAKKSDQITEIQEPFVKLLQENPSRLLTALIDHSENRAAVRGKRLREVQGFKTIDLFRT